MKFPSETGLHTAVPPTPQAPGGSTQTATRLVQDKLLHGRPTFFHMRLIFQSYSSSGRDEKQHNIIMHACTPSSRIFALQAVTSMLLSAVFAREMGK